MINYIDEFPLPNHLIPENLKELLALIDNTSSDYINAACAYNTISQTVPHHEIFCDMTTVTVPLDKIENMPLLYLNHGVVSTGPDNDSEGMCDGNYTIGGFYSLISSWGNGSLFTYNLSDKVWMTLGLTPCCHNDNSIRYMWFSDMDFDASFSA